MTSTGLGEMGFGLPAGDGAEFGEPEKDIISLNADVSKELIQTIFQKKTLLHDGAMVIKNGRIVSAGTILPLSERIAPSQYGTRHRAAMGITEQMEDILCIVVSEETGSISLAEINGTNCLS
jgi:DNA integrity scanning protein DisA with diadenylate cyclase activity